MWPLPQNLNVEIPLIPQFLKPKGQLVKSKAGLAVMAIPKKKADSAATLVPKASDAATPVLTTKDVSTQTLNHAATQTDPQRPPLATPPPSYSPNTKTNNKKGKDGNSKYKNRGMQTDFEPGSEPEAQKSKKTNAKANSAGAQKVTENTNTNKKNKNAQANKGTPNEKNGANATKESKEANQKKNNKATATKGHEAAKTPSEKEEQAVNTREVSLASASSDESNVDQAFAASQARGPHKLPLEQEPQGLSSASEVSEDIEDLKQAVLKCIEDELKKKQRNRAMKKADVDYINAWLLKTQADAKRFATDWVAKQAENRTKEADRGVSLSPELVPWNSSQAALWNTPSEWQNISLPLKSSLSRPVPKQWSNSGTNVNHKPHRHVSFASPAFSLDGKSKTRRDHFGSDGLFRFVNTVENDIPPYRSGFGMTPYEPQYAEETSHGSADRNLQQTIMDSFKSQTPSQGSKDKKKNKAGKTEHTMSGALDNSNLQAAKPKQRKKVHYKPPSVFSATGYTSNESSDDSHSEGSDAGDDTDATPNISRLFVE
ncbi:hypothetical protein MMC13_002219 [Lambiella insularis]|nr:hypothetical protein [Lambiella insularis]